MSTHKVSITLLSDNRTAYGLEAEHGISFWIQSHDRHVLFDTGNGPVMPRNTQTLGVDLTCANDVVLSHGHYDHTGNVPFALRQAPHAHVHLHPAALRQRYSIREFPKPIGIPLPSAEAIDALPATQRHWVTAPATLDGGIGLTGPVPRGTGYEDTGGPFFMDTAGRQTDGIPDDLSLWVATDAGLVVCLGCCHAGVVNTLRHIIAAAGEKRIIAVVGGMHLSQATEERLARTAQAFRELAIPHIIPCHCTGDDATAFLTRELGSTVQQGYAGMRVAF